MGGGGESAGGGTAGGSAGGAAGGSAAGSYELVYSTTSYTGPFSPLAGAVLHNDVWIHLNVVVAPSVIDHVEWSVDGTLFRNDDQAAPYDLTYVPAAYPLASWGGSGTHQVGAKVLYVVGRQPDLIAATVTVTGAGGGAGGGTGGGGAAGGTAGGSAGGSAGGAAGGTAGGAAGGAAGGSAGGAGGGGATITHGIQIDATNTGVPAGTQLTAVTGTVTLSTSGQVWENKSLSGTIVVSASNVTIRNCVIKSNGYYAIQVNSGSNVLIENCEIYSPTGSYTGITGDGFTVRRCNIHNFENGFIAQSNDLIEENYIHDLYYGPGAHVDGIEWGGSGNNDTVRRNRIMLGADTGCVNITPYGGGQANNNTIQDNFFFGGTYSLYIRGDGGGSVSGVVVSGNIWAKNSYTYGTSSIVSATNVTWTNNKLDDGTTVNP